MIALQIEWVGSIAYRVDIAEIGEEVWIAVGPMRRLVALARLVTNYVYFLCWL
jgi:hypothetical protein